MLKFRHLIGFSFATGTPDIEFHMEVIFELSHEEHRISLFGKEILFIFSIVIKLIDP